MTTNNADNFNLVLPLSIANGGTGLTALPTSNSYTPVITGSSSNPTVSYSSQKGYYLQIGNQVFWQVNLILNSISGGSGKLLVNLPSNPYNPGLQIPCYCGGGFIFNGSNFIRVISASSNLGGIGSVALYPTNISNSLNLPTTTIVQYYLSGIYAVA